MGASNGGFAFIEVVVVLAIIAILALIAVPSYQNRIVREQILEAGPLTDLAKKQVAGVWTATQSLPADNPGAGLPHPEKMVNNVVGSVAVETGAIQVTFGNQVNRLIKGKVLSIRPAIVEDAPIVPIAWVCGYAPVPDHMTVKGKNRTDIPEHYLPLNCQPR